MTGIDSIEELGRRYAQADRAGATIPFAQLHTDGLVPEDFEAAMAVQRAFVRASGKPVKGWKLAIRPDDQAIGAPMLDCYRVDDKNIAFLPQTGTEGIEVEICFILSSDIPVRGAAPFTRTELMRCIDTIHIGIELLRFRLVEKNHVPFPLFLADRLANHGFIIGPEIDGKVLDVFAGQEADLPRLVVTEGATQAFDATAKHPNGDALAPLLAFANSTLNKGDMLKAGSVVTTGSLCGFLPSTLALDIHIDLKPVGVLILTGSKSSASVKPT